MTAQYTITEKNQFLKWYYAGNSLRQVQGLFAGLYPDRAVPAVSAIQKVIENQNKYGSVFKPCQSCYKKSLDLQGELEVVPRDNNTEINVLAAVINNPNISTRDIGKELNIHPTTAFKILKKHKYISYKYSNHHELLERDYFSRMLFCETIMDMANRDRNFIKNICFSDESTFSINGEPNRQNYRYWATDNPRLMIDNHSQYPQTVNTWVGILGSEIIGPFFITGSLTGQKYLELLQNYIGPAIDTVAGENVVWFQHDGCPAHCTTDVVSCLNEFFPNSWIGRGGPINWPARSPDISPNDFFLWGHLKSKIYGQRHLSVDSLKNKIVEECRKVTARQLANMRRNFYDRLGFCLAIDGRQFEHLL